MGKNFDESGGFVMPKMTIMPPTVINVSNPPAENVASRGLICAHDDSSFFQRCVNYNTLFCKIECSEYADRKKQKPVSEEIYTEYEADAIAEEQKPISRDPEDELNIEK